jgi:hypothetical protein
MNPCPCGLTREELVATNGKLFDENGRCTAFDAQNQLCGRRLVDHPHTPGKNILLPSPPLIFSRFSIFVVQQPPPQALYSARFSWKQSKSSLYSFSNYDGMLGRIHQKWPVLKHKHLLVVTHKDSLLAVVDDESLNNLFVYLRSTGNIINVELFVDTKCIGFSDYSSKPELVLDLLKCKINEKAKFVADTTIPAEKYDYETVVVRNELLRRRKLLDLEQASEYTLRELISPVLFGALSLVDDDPSEEGVKLICEKIISGNSGQGPVDYILSYKSVYIVIGEAKKCDLMEGFNQNVMQQWNYLESLADKCLPLALSGSKRKHDFETQFRGLINLGTYGITSTGYAWMFSRVEAAPEGYSHPVIVHRSETYDITFFHQDTNNQIAIIDQQVGVLLRIIVHMIKAQKSMLSSKFSYLLSPDIQSQIQVADQSEMMRNVKTKENDDEVDGSGMMPRAEEAFET